MMARTYAQAAALVFLIVGLGGLLTGDAGHVVHGRASGNFDGVALHLTYVRDVINIAIGLGFVYAGWRAGERDAAITVLAAGAVLLLLAVAGFIANDDDAGTRSFATLHFPLAINIFDLITGTLGVLCGLGTLGEEPVTTG